MIRKAMIALAALTFVGAMTASSTVDARAFGGGGIRAGGFGGGGLRAGFAGAFRGGLVAPGRVAFRPGIGPRFGFRSGFGPRFGFRNRVFFANRFFPRRFARRFAFAAVPLGIYGASCWRWVPTAWGWQRTWVCGYDYGYGYGYYGYY
jgi:hypothetical protein